jgi:uncharacterized phage protein (TIGR01671 family)
MNNMREIKFRAWNSVTEKMFDSERLFAMSVFALEEGLDPKKFIILPNQKEYPLMQFTGMLDKNDIEIYEGDIVRGVKGTNNQGQSDVFYDCGVWQPFAYLETRYSKDFEVIGNIYEGVIDG